MSIKYICIHFSTCEFIILVLIVKVPENGLYGVFNRGDNIIFILKVKFYVYIKMFCILLKFIFLLENI